jgi:flagellar protein FlgJ
MIDRLGASGPANLSPGEDARLRRAAAQMEGVFFNQMLQALRETVPRDGVLDGGAGEEMFTSLMDEKIAESASAKQEHGLGAVLYRQLRAAFFGGGR